MRLSISMNQLREQFREGKNILQILRTMEASQLNSREGILASYDLQAGSYVIAQRDAKHHAICLQYSAAIARLLDSLGARSFLEAGVGEATTLAHVVRASTNPPLLAAGFDISWSRIAYGKAYAHEQGQASQLFVGDIFAIPVISGAVDVVYTSHSIEPNRGREKEALAELYRVARRFVVLLEPASTFGNEATKERIITHSYCSDLERHARELGYRVKEHRLFEFQARHINQTELIIIEKPATEGIFTDDKWLACPCCKSAVISHKGHMYCDNCCLIFPVIDDIPCLLPDAGILGSKFLDF